MIEARTVSCVRWSLFACERVVLNRGSMKSVCNSMDNEGFFDEEVLMFMVRCFGLRFLR